MVPGQESQRLIFQGLRAASSRSPQRPWHTELSLFPEEEQRARTGTGPGGSGPSRLWTVRAGGAYRSWGWGPKNFGCLALSPATRPQFSNNWAQMRSAWGLQACKYSG